MTAIIGFCLENGAFLAADSARTDADSGQLWSAPVKKIEKLRDGIFISTGGLGTIGHIARDELIAFVQSREMSLSAVIDRAADIFSDAYRRSFVSAPRHNIPLTCVLAGKDDEGKGFICSLSSSNNFEPFWVRNVGQPYFTGSNTDIVIQAVSDVIHLLKSTDNKLLLDKWVIESVKRVMKVDNSVSFPLQLVAVSDQTLNIFPVCENHSYLSELVTEFPEL
ncbi:hypothetical protein [Idiomarina abyssalis]|uniref:hypothetical protein n=1 Tax=Idiomarina abyssalis TaxID=86102 RepID=UPI003A8E4E73